jgi:Outer membrane receptor proteins, mostly Fe transport
MRIILLIIAVQMISILKSNGQQVAGLLKDESGNPVSNATVALVKVVDSSIEKLGISNQSGNYNLIGIKPGNYLVKSTHVGYKPIFSSSFSVTSEDVKVPDLQMSKTSGDLKSVVVTAQKPIIEVKADKTIVNVEGTINSVGQDAMELLRKSPGVTVDKDDNLALSGKNGVQVYIDGRPTPLSGQDLANYLRSLQSSQIESIEIITNPSAKYDAAGNAGIINIRLKKNKSFGTNGSVNGGWNIGTYAKYNAGFSLNYRNKGINIFGNYNYNKGINENTFLLYRTVLDTLFDQNSTAHFNNETHNFKAGADFFIDKKNTVGVMANGTYSTPSISTFSKTPISYIPTGEVNRILVANNTSAFKRDNINFNLNYSYQEASGKSLVVNADHGTFDINSDQYQPNYYFDPSGQNLISSVINQMIAPTTININTAKADYEQNIGKGKLGIGAKTAFVKTDNDFQRYNVMSTGKDLDKERSNRFRYTENINAAYVNYNRAFKGLMIQAGLRVENTISDGVSNGQKESSSGYVNYDSSFHRSYTDLFPSAAITFNKNPKSQLGLTYSRRIDRPNYQDLNPFEFKLDEYTFMKGNINLRPQYTNSFGITHTYNYRLTTAINYSHVKDLFTQLVDTSEGSKAFLSKKNLATQNVVSLNISYPFTYKTYTVFGNVNSFYSHYKADFGSGRIIDLDVVAVNLFIQNSLKFKKTWTAELTGFYNSPQVYQGTFKAKALWSIDGGLQKAIFKGKGTIKAAVSDIFHTLKFDAESDFAGQVTKPLARWESRQFKLNFTYRFGSNQVKAARQRSTSAEDENKRVQSGSGSIIGQ